MLHENTIKSKIQKTCEKLETNYQKWISIRTKSHRGRKRH